MGNLEKLLIVIILATIAVITALAFLDAGSEQSPTGDAGGRAQAKPGPSSMKPAPLSASFDALQNQGTESGDEPEVPQDGGAGSETPGIEPSDDATDGQAESTLSDPSGGPADADATAMRPVVAPETGDHQGALPTDGETATLESKLSRRPHVKFLDDVAGYTVQIGDTYEAIAESVLGSASLAATIRDANQDVRGEEPEPGTVLLIPIGSRHLRERNATRGTHAPSPAEGEPNPRTPPEEAFQTHAVKKGETLSGISRQYYGTPNRWKRILEANRKQLTDPRDLRPGMTLEIPPANR